MVVVVQIARPAPPRRVGLCRRKRHKQRWQNKATRSGQPEWDEEVEDDGDDDESDEDYLHVVVCMCKAKHIGGECFNSTRDKLSELLLYLEGSRLTVDRFSRTHLARESFVVFFF